MLRPNADLGVKLGILDTAAGLWPQVAAFLLVTSPVATGACVCNQEPAAGSAAAAAVKVVDCSRRQAPAKL
jgi:hypothetical protein